MGGPASTRAHPFFGGLDWRTHLPNRRPLRMVARSNRDRVEISRLIRSLSFIFTLQQLSEREQGRGGLALVAVDAARKHVCHVLGIAGINTMGKRQRMLPKGVEDVLQDVNAHLREE